jgi:hypothetical protein
MEAVDVVVVKLSYIIPVTGIVIGCGERCMGERSITMSCSLADVDIISFVVENDESSLVKIAFLRRSLYAIDEEFWSRIVDSERYGFGAPTKRFEFPTL